MKFIPRRTDVKAIFNGTTIAESNETIVVEGNHYFPPESVNYDHLSRTEDEDAVSMEGPRQLLLGHRRRQDQP